MRPVPDRSNHLPEDDLPSWVFDMQDCLKCGKVIDEGQDYDEFNIDVCNCEEE